MIETDNLNLILEMKRLLRNRNGNYHLKEDKDGELQIYLDEVGEDGKPTETFIGSSVCEAVEILKAMQGIEVAKAKAAVQSKPFRFS